MDITKELREHMRSFQKAFGDIVPLRQLPKTVTNEQLIEAIKTSLEQKQNLLPEIFHYADIEKDSSKPI